jgi:aminobenzoyl-glutamate utilization protein B
VTAQGKTPAAHKGMTHAAKMMAGTAIDLLEDAELLAAAKADHQARLGKTAYVCPIPEDVNPPLQPRPKEAA